MELHKGGLISESSPNLVQSAQERDLAPSFGDTSQSKKTF